MQVTNPGGEAVRVPYRYLVETALPADLKLACLMQVAREWKKATLNEWGVISKSSPDGMSVTKTETGLLKEVREILDRYRSFAL